MTPEEIAWCAGLFEGEGSFSVSRPARGDRIYPVIGLVMADEDIVELFAQRLGAGLIRPERPRYPGAKLQHRWRLNGVPAFEIAELLSPWLGERRRGQVERAAIDCANQPVRRPHGGRPRLPFGS